MEKYSPKTLQILKEWFIVCRYRGLLHCALKMLSNGSPVMRSREKTADFRQFFYFSAILSRCAQLSFSRFNILWSWFHTAFPRGFLERLWNIHFFTLGLESATLVSNNLYIFMGRLTLSQFYPVRAFHKNE